MIVARELPPRERLLLLLLLLLLGVPQRCSLISGGEALEVARVHLLLLLLLLSPLLLLLLLLNQVEGRAGGIV